ncbi:MAG TPA: hypothetical protein VGD88_06025 [Opitutaceae bacterium]
MKSKTMSFILLFVALASGLNAESLKLKYAQLVELGSALSALDGAQRVVPQGDGKPSAVVFTAYELGGKTRLVIARNVAAIKTPLEAFEQTRQALLKQVSPGAPEKVATDPELTAKFIALWNDATKDPVTVDLAKIPEDDLKLDANAVPPSVLTALLPILK